MKRLGLFRSLCQQAPIVLLDAPLESLNDELSDVVRNYLWNHHKNQTLICTHHHSDFLENFDQIISVENGLVTHQKHTVRPLC